jgi:HK97 family phage major capsid protein
MKELSDRGLKSEGNLYIPEKVINSRSTRFVNDRMMTDRRAINALTATGGTGGDQGGLTIQEDVLTLIDILRKKLPFVDSMPGSGDGLGATFWTGLDGDVSFPRVDNEGADPDTKAENASADEVDPRFDDIKLSPKRLPAWSEYSRQLLLQSTVDVENWLRNHLMYKITKSMNINIMDYLIALSGTNAVINGDNGAALTWAKVVEFETKIADADAEEEERFAFLTNAKVRGKLKTTEMATNTAQFIWDKNSNQVNNYPAFVSSVVPSDIEKGNSGETLSAAILANWAALYLGMWGGIDMLVNPYTGARTGKIEVNIWTFFDRVARRPESFSVSKDIVTT